MIAQVHSFDRSGAAHVHTEKKWALPFPPSYIWIQARDHKFHQGVTDSSEGCKHIWWGITAASFRAANVALCCSPRPLHSPYLPSQLGMATAISYLDRTAMINITGWSNQLRISAVAE